jgi:hypothetical protein
MTLISLSREEILTGLRSGRTLVIDRRDSPCLPDVPVARFDRATVRRWRLPLRAGAALGERSCSDVDRRVLGLLREIGREPRALGFTRFGYPRHPLYVRTNSPLISMGYGDA